MDQIFVALLESLTSAKSRLVRIGTIIALGSICLALLMLPLWTGWF